MEDTNSIPARVCFKFEKECLPRARGVQMRSAYGGKEMFYSPRWVWIGLDGLMTAQHAHINATNHSTFTLGHKHQQSNPPLTSICQYLLPKGTEHSSSAHCLQTHFYASPHQATQPRERPRSQGRFRRRDLDG